MKHAIDIAAAVNAKESSASAELATSLAVIAEKNEAINAFLFVDTDGAKSFAATVDERIAKGEQLPLAGVPVAIKDNLCQTGVPTTCSSKILAGWRPPYTATVVERLIAAGAIPVGKTNLDEFAMGSSTETSAFGPTKNPLDLSRVPGGSSGGSAAAVA
ncbi:MAG: amidase, partial [Actinomycetota bacterium]